MHRPVSSYPKLVEDSDQFPGNNPSLCCDRNELVRSGNWNMNAVIEKSSLQNALDAPVSLQCDQIVVPGLHQLLCPLKMCLGFKGQSIDRMLTVSQVQSRRSNLGK
ncbi:MAG: hypothetical protein CMP27_03485 [Roseibacillus sp.]|nr:hypothetical protein [Roseibacillus sp.]